MNEEIVVAIVTVCITEDNRQNMIKNFIEDCFKYGHDPEACSKYITDAMKGQWRVLG